MEEKKKIFVLDTNVILTDPKSIFAFENNIVVIPMIVIEEIDTFKKNMNNLGVSARKFSRIMDFMRSKCKLIEGYDTREGGIIKIFDIEYLQILKYFRTEQINNDNIILATAKYILEETKNEVIVVSRDVNVRVKADVLNLQAETYTTDNVKACNVPIGYRIVEVAGHIISQMHSSKIAENLGVEIENMYPNEYFLLKNIENPQNQAIVRWTGEVFLLMNTYGKVGGISPKNIEQKIALDLILNPDIPLVNLIGRAGTGKTLISLACGIREVFELGNYNKLIVSKPVIAIKNSNDIGFLPGTLEEKMKPWLAPIYDNLEFILTNNNGSIGSEEYKNIDHIMESEFIDVQVLAYMRGRSIPNNFVVIDEVQNVSAHEIKTIISRIGEGTKIILCGDIEQIDSPYLDSESNGLIYSLDRLKHSNLTGHIIFQKGERSKLADLAVECL